MNSAAPYVLLAGVFVSLWTAVGYGRPKTDLPLQVYDFQLLDLKDYRKEKDRYNGEEVTPPTADKVVKKNAARILRKWTPTGASDDPYSLRCHPREMAKTLLARRGDHAAVGAFLRDYFARCQYELSRNTSKGLVSLAAYKRINFDVLDNPDLRPFEIRFTNGSTARGFLALKPDSKPRPMIVFKCGLYCEADSRAATVVLLYLHLFDENPFHLMVLENHSSSSNMVRNQRFILGGFYEGQEVFEIGRWLREESEFAPLISDLHLIGASMGGGAAAFGALINGLNRGATEAPIFDSSVAFCGAVNLGETMREVFQNNFRSFFFATRAYMKMTEVKEVPELHGLVGGRLKIPKPEKYVEIVGEAGRRFLAGIEPHHYFYPFNRMPPVITVDDFWERNSIVNYSHLIRTPLLVWSSMDDWMVPYHRNTGLLHVKHGNDDTFVQTVALPYGNHCGTSLMYGWETTSKLLRAYFVNNSPNFREEFKLRTMPVAFPRVTRQSHEMHVAQRWIAKRDKVMVAFTTWNSQRRACRNAGAFMSPRRCYKDRAVALSWSELEPLGLKRPKTKYEEQALTRWLNANVEIHGATGPLIGSLEKPAFIRWWPE